MKMTKAHNKINTTSTKIKHKIQKKNEFKILKQNCISY